MYGITGTSALPRIHLLLQEEEKKENHEFYEILLSYLRARRNLLQSEGEITVLHEQYKELIEQSWVTSKHFVTAKVCMT